MPAAVLEQLTLPTQNPGAGAVSMRAIFAVCDAAGKCHELTTEVTVGILDLPTDIRRKLSQSVRDLAVAELGVTLATTDIIMPDYLRGVF